MAEIERNIRLAAPRPTRAARSSCGARFTRPTTRPTVPASALFRRGESWNVFVVERGRARRREVEIGHRSAREVEIAKGRNVGEQVIRHPSNDIDEGRRVRVAK